MMRTVLIIQVLLLLICSSAMADVINVPADAATIQAAIDQAQTFDTVVVAAGTYTGTGNRDMSFLGKQILVMSADGAEATIIDCQGTAQAPHRAFSFVSGETANSVLDGFTITNGFAPSHPDYPIWPMGGGIRIASSSPSIRNCRFIANFATNGGAGLACVNGSNPSIQNCLFENNQATYGAGLYCYQASSPSVNGCTFVNNSAEIDGGGTNCAYSSSPTITSCVYIDNSAAIGGAIQCYGSSNAVLTNCTMVRNSADYGSAVSNNGSTSSVINSIIAFGSGNTVVNCVMGGACEISCSDAFGNANGDWVGCMESQADVNGNLSSNPQFCDASNNDLRIAESSPCAPANNSCGILIGAMPTNPDCVFQIHVWRVRADGTGDAPTIQAAIDSAGVSDTVLVEAGTYTGNGNRDISLRGKLVVVISESGPALTILNCEGTVAVPHRAFDVTLGEGPNSVISGFTITGGVALSQPPYPDWPMGGGIRCLSSSPVVQNCIFLNNSAQNGGGGLAAVNMSAPSVIDCRFAENQATYGGGLYFYEQSSGTATNCVFIGNSASIDGGAVEASYSSLPHITGCSFIENSALIGGGVQCYGGSDAVIENCTFVDNAATHGSAASSNWSDVTINKSIIAFGHNGPVSNCVNFGSISLSCCDVFGNDGGDWVECFEGQDGISGNFSLNPVFCDRQNGDVSINFISPCAPDNNSCNVLVGALAVGCSFACGDENGDGTSSISDCVYLVNYIFSGGPQPLDNRGGDLNCDGRTNISDVVYLVNYIFGSGPAPCQSC